MRSGADRDRRRAESRRHLPLPGLTGETRAYESRHFCPTCGSPLFDRWGDELELHAGCLDAPNRLTPTYESWVVRREAWLPAFEGMTRYEHNRDA